MTLSAVNREKQKALYHYLSSVLTEQQTLDALVLWQDKYATKPGFSVRYFADEVSKISNGARAPKELMLNMVTAIASKKQYEVDPSEKIEQYRLQSGRFFGSQDQTHVEAFNLLVDKLFESLEPRVRLFVMRQITDNHLDNTDISLKLKAHVQALHIDAPLVINLTGVSVDELKLLLNAIYVILCGQLGPVATDGLFANTLKKLQQNGGAQYAEIFKQLM